MPNQYQKSVTKAFEYEFPLNLAKKEEILVMLPGVFLRLKIESQKNLWGMLLETCDQKRQL